MRRRTRIEFRVQGGRQAVGPFFRLSKLGMVPVLATLYGPDGPFLLAAPGDRNFDASPSRDLNFDPLSWFEPPFFGRVNKDIKV